MAKKLSSDEVRAIIIREIDNSLGLDGTKLAISRRDALKYYEGLPFGNEMAGRSQVISRDVMEAVEWSLPALLRIFMAGDDVVKFEPQGPEDEQAAKQATEYVNFIFMRDNPGFQITYNWFKDALLSKNGFIKAYWEKRTQIKTEHYSGLTELEYKAITTPQTEDEDVEVVEENTYPMASAGGPGLAAPANPADGAASPMVGAPPAAPQLYDVVLKRKTKQGKVCVDCVPPEEMLITRRAVNIESASYVAHRTQRTRSELKEMGFDPKLVDSIPVEDEQEYNTERVQRFLPEEEFPFSPLRTDGPAQVVWLIESYIKIDEDGDGIAELRKITTAGSRAQVILDDEEVDEVPFVSITPMPMPHKFFGMSLADLVMDLQLIKSTLWRQALDNLYLTNTPRHLVIDAPGFATTNTIDDLLLSRPGGIVRAANPEAVQALTTPFVADKAIPMMEMIDEIKETRTGVSKRNQGISPDDLNKTAAGMSMLQQAAAQRVELIARVFAETGMKALFGKILGLVTRYQDKARVIKLRNQWVPMDPRQWRNSFDLSVSVGLGTGNKDQMLTHLTNLGQAYAATIKAQGGVNGPVLTWKHVHKFLESTVQNMGFKNAEEWVQDPQNAPPQQPQPSEAMIQAQADMQLKDKEIQGKMQLAQFQAQIDAALAQQKMQHEQQLADQESQHRMALERMQAEADMATQQFKAEVTAKLEAMKAGLKIHELNTKHIGDKLGAALQEGKIAYDPPPPKEEKPDPMIELGGHLKDLVANLAKPKRVVHIRGKDGRIAESRAE